MAFLASLLPTLISAGVSGYQTYASMKGGSTSYGPPSVFGGKRRRKRTKLSHSQLIELQNIKSILGRTAAANALPYYLGK
jgi:hypothetical protein